MFEEGRNKALEGNVLFQKVNHPSTDSIAQMVLHNIKMRSRQ